MYVYIHIKHDYLLLLLFRNELHSVFISVDAFELTTRPIFGSFELQSLGHASTFGPKF